jgi:hypothetical protein
MHEQDTTRTGRRFSWIKLDDHLSEHPKILEVGPLAAWLYVCSIQYANRRRTDGFVPARAIYTLVDLGECGIVRGCVGKAQEPDYGAVYAAELAERLVAAGLWETVEGGYHIHDYLDYQASAEKIDQFRAKDRTRKLHMVSARIPDGIPVDSPVQDKDVDIEEDIDIDGDPDGDRAGAAAAAACVPDPVDWVWDYYKAEIHPEARVCPRAAILARLQRFEVDELTVGIEHFRDDAWCMEHNRTRGGAWFFHDDHRSEHFLTMTPRAAPRANGIARGRHG